MVGLIAVCGACLPFTAFAQAPNARGAVTIAVLGVEKPAVIVSNPFYGMTDMFRGMKDSFASGNVNKLLVRIDTLNRKAAELLKMREVAPGNNRLTSKALSEYQVAVYQYSFAAGKLQAADLASNDTTRDLAQTLVQTAIIHLRLIDELLATAVQSSDKAVLTDILESFTDANIRLFDEVIGIDSVRLQLPVTGDMTEVRIAEMLSLLAKRAATLGTTDLAQTFLSMRASLLDTIALRLAATPSAPEQFSAKIAQVATFAAPAAVSMAMSAPTTQVDEQAFMELSQLAGGSAERAQTLSYLLSRPELLQNESLMALRNGLLMEVFSR